MNKHNTVAELLAAWDAGETIWSIEMGGLGPGYEQAIQVLAIELMRDCAGQPLPESEEAERAWGKATISRVDKDCGGFSGAQVGAAKQIAYKFIKQGPQAALAEVQDDRRILVSKFWPHVSVETP
jgi:hypothetical protein